MTYGEALAVEERYPFIFKDVDPSQYRRSCQVGCSCEVCDALEVLGEARCRPPVIVGDDESPARFQEVDFIRLGMLPPPGTVAVPRRDGGIKFVLPSDSKERKEIPLATGCLDYFPAALAEVAKLSKKGNDKHNPGQPLHHARGKSVDHDDCLIRHFLDRGSIDPDTGLDHMVEVCWRALARLQQMCEERGAPMARGASND